MPCACPAPRGYPPGPEPNPRGEPEMTQTSWLVAIVDDDPVRVPGAAPPPRLGRAPRDHLPLGGGPPGLRPPARRGLPGAGYPHFVFITAHDDLPTREGARRTCGLAYLPKTFDDAALLEAIARAWAGGPEPARKQIRNPKPEIRSKFEYPRQRKVLYSELEIRSKFEWPKNGKIRNGTTWARENSKAAVRNSKQILMRKTRQIRNGAALK